MRELAERIRRGRQAVRIAKQRGMDTSKWKSRLEELFATAGREPEVQEGMEPWMLWEWRRVSIPLWRNILEESVFEGDIKREDYARWMLLEILLDPDYEEGH